MLLLPMIDTPLTFILKFFLFLNHKYLNMLNADNRTFR